MTSSADLLRLAIVEESTPGVTPSNPAFQLMRATGESLSYAPEVARSNELPGFTSRGVTDVIVTGGASSGSIDFELSRNPGMDMLLEGVFGNKFGAGLPPTKADELTVGQQLLSYSIEKRFTLDGTINAYDYHRVSGVVVDQLSLAFTAGQPATGSAQLTGSHYKRADAELAGASYLPAGNDPIIFGGDIGDITFRIGADSFSGWCVGSLNINFRNNTRRVQCLGRTGGGEASLGVFEAEITATVYLGAYEQTRLVDAFLAKDFVSLQIVTAQHLASDPGYAFQFDKCRISAATVVASGAGQDVVIALTLAALLPDAPDADGILTPAYCARLPVTP